MKAVIELIRARKEVNREVRALQTDIAVSELEL